MSLPRKTGPPQALNLNAPAPNPPEVPSEMIEKFPILATYQTGIKDWWSRFEDFLAKQNGSVQTQFSKDEASLASSTDSLQASIDAINAQIKILQAQTADPPIDTALVAQVNALSVALQKHIDSAIVHGTQSPVVGESDPQLLDSKTIGSNVPGYGRFTQQIGIGTILAGQTLSIAAGEFSIVAGPYPIFGTLAVEGTFVAL